MYRGRRLRKNPRIRSMVQENHIHCEELIYPIFVVEGMNIYQEIETMRDQYQYSIDQLARILDEMMELNISTCLLFGVVNHKDAYGSEAYNEKGIVQEAIRFIKKNYPDIYVISDVCMCEYTDHGHCGILNEEHIVENDETLKYLNKIAVSYALAGVDMVAPSAMMDGTVASIRRALDEAQFESVAIMGYSAKYASSFYGPFREAAHSTPSFGDRKGYQMDMHNAREAMREIQADIDEGVDVIMVKPAMPYLDIVAKARSRYDTPLCVYQVSGEYAMIKVAIKEKLLSEDAIMESIISMKRAGADCIITYFALDLARIIKEGKR